MAGLFLPLPLMIFGGMSRFAAALAWLALATMLGGAYVQNATTDSSTAPLVFLVPIIYGVPATFMIFVIDAFVRAWDWRGGTWIRR